MTRAQFRLFLVKHEACETALEYLDQQPARRTVGAIIRTCRRTGWLEWLYAKMPERRRRHPDNVCFNFRCSEECQEFTRTKGMAQLRAYYAAK